MDRLFMLFGDVGDSKSGGGDTWCDRLNCKYTVYLLVFFALLVTTRHFVDEPIACWGPSHFTSSQVEYLNKVSFEQLYIYLLIVLIEYWVDLLNRPASPIYNLWFILFYMYSSY